MKRWLLILLFLILAGTVWLVGFRKDQAPVVDFAKVGRERLVSTLATNGKVEPIHWAGVRTERAGLISRLLVKRGQKVDSGSPIAELSDSASAAAIQSADARVAQAEAELSDIRRGGKSVELAEIEGQISKLETERRQAEEEAARVRRLVEKKAAPAQELTVLQDRLSRLDAEIASQQQRRRALVGQNDRGVAEARLREAQSAAGLARKTAAQRVLRSPIAGLVYSLPIKAGMYLNAGDLVAEVGNLERVRITVYVDEPELGRVKPGQAMTVTWDAKPGREWKGVVDTIPLQITTLGSRNVGEVLSIADNPGAELPAGANVNVRIVSQIVENALTIPKEALRRESDDFGVFVLKGERLEWRKVQLGASNVTRAEIVSGLSEGDSIALPSELPLKTGTAVTPRYP